MNDSKPSAPSSPASHAGTSAAPPAPARVAQSPAAPLATAAATPGSAPALFGGHRGGGKRRADGLPAGGPEAKAADRAKDAARMATRRAAVKATALPAALPSLAAAAAADPGAALAGGASAVLGPSPVTGVAVVLWNPRLLEKPARLVTRIVDRLRKASATKRLDHPKLPPEMRAEILEGLVLPPEALADFSTALADCAAVELNKRGVGAGQSHWVAVFGVIAELGAHQIAWNERVDRILEKLDESPAEEKQEEKKI